MISLRNKSIGIILCLLSGFVLNAQVLIKATADRDMILVGEPLRVTVEARLPLGVKVNWFQLDSIPHFEWIDKGVQQDTNDVDGKKIIQTFTVTSYDTGHWSIPQLAIRIDNRSYASDTLGVDVRYSPGFNAEEDYRDIKETEEVDVPLEKNLRWWIFGGLTFVALAVILYLLRKKAPRKMVIKQNPLSPYEEAMQEIAKLKKQELQPAEIKNYYTRLNDILRTYLSRQLLVSTYEKTNEEIILQMRSQEIPKEQFTQLAQALRLSDFVKFAKYTPSTEDNRGALQVIESAVNTLNRSVVAKAAATKTN